MAAFAARLGLQGIRRCCLPLLQRCSVKEAAVRVLSTSRPSFGLMEFFDKKENFKEPSVKTGRPWKLDELRLKSNQDLHKLWYVLLKEMNMLLTMQAEYDRLHELFPSPERLEKVEESMDNLALVVSERNRAFNLLETGATGEPELVDYVNELGLVRKRPTQEHYVPKHSNPKLNTALLKAAMEPIYGGWQEHYKRLYAEQRLRAKGRSGSRAVKRFRKMQQAFPHVDRAVAWQASVDQTAGK